MEFIFALFPTEYRWATAELKEAVLYVLGGVLIGGGLGSFPGEHGQSQHGAHLACSLPGLSPASVLTRHIKLNKLVWAAQKVSVCSQHLQIEKETGLSNCLYGWGGIIAQLVPHTSLFSQKRPS